MSEAKRVADLVDRLAKRILDRVNDGSISVDELRGSADVALVIDAAKLLEQAGAEFPSGLRRLAETANLSPADTTVLERS
jgi:hypothetical protein